MLAKEIKGKWQGAIPVSKEPFPAYTSGEELLVEINPYGAVIDLDVFVEAENRICIKTPNTPKRDSSDSERRAIYLGKPLSLEALMRIFSTKYKDEDVGTVRLTVN